MTRNDEAVLQWCRDNLKTPSCSFAEMEAAVKAREAFKREQAVRFAGCKRVTPKDERRVA